MKKIYKEPQEIVIELGLEGQLLDVSGGQGDGGPLDKTPTDPEGGEGMSRSQSVWDGQW